MGSRWPDERASTLADGREANCCGLWLSSQHMLRVGEKERRGAPFLTFDGCNRKTLRPAKVSPKAVIH